MSGRFRSPDGALPRSGAVSARRPGRPPSFGFCTICGQRTPRARAVRRFPGAFLCQSCGREEVGVFLPPRRARARRLELPELSTVENDGMVRKNLTITSDEDTFLQSHREINQSALFRRAIVSLMQAEADEVRRSRRGGSAR